MSKKMTKKKARELTAIHEAGHAVLLHKLNMPIESVSIYASRISKGRVNLFDCYDYDERIDGRYPLLPVLLAGAAAEALHTNEGSCVHGSDFQEAVRLLDLLEIPSDQHAGHLDEAALRAAESLSESWTAVIVLASLLLTFKKIDGESVHQLIDLADQPLPVLQQLLGADLDQVTAADALLDRVFRGDDPPTLLR